MHMRSKHDIIERTVSNVDYVRYYILYRRIVVREENVLQNEFH